MRTGAAQAAEDASRTRTSSSPSSRDFLLAFGGIALFVGAFVIANSLSITIAQRTREFATLRTLGASRRQVLDLDHPRVARRRRRSRRSSGLFLGLGLAKGLFKLFDAVGFTLPNSGLLFETRTIVVSLLVGILVTLLASLRPALRATRVPPIAAVREGATLPEGRFARFRTPVGAASRPPGFAALVYGLFGTGLGTTQILSGWASARCSSSSASRCSRRASSGRSPASSAGPRRRIGGAAGALARDNARRNPQRTASTAAALMIGLALVTLVATLAAGITQSFRGAVNDLFTGDYAITAQNNFSPIPIAAAEAAAQAPGVTAVGSVRTGEARVFGKTEFATAVDPGMRRRHLDSTGSRARRTTSSRRSEPTGPSSTTATRRTTTSRSARRSSHVRRAATTKTFVVKGIFDPPTRRLAVRRRHDLGRRVGRQERRRRRTSTRS